MPTGPSPAPWGLQTPWGSSGCSLQTPPEWPGAVGLRASQCLSAWTHAPPPCSGSRAAEGTGSPSSFSDSCGSVGARFPAQRHQGCERCRHETEDRPPALALLSVPYPTGSLGTRRGRPPTGPSVATWQNQRLLLAPHSPPSRDPGAPYIPGVQRPEQARGLTPGPCKLHLRFSIAVRLGLGWGRTGNPLPGNGPSFTRGGLTQSGSWALRRHQRV